MNIVVTGASGFIGGHLCSALAESGHYVTAVSRAPLIHGSRPRQVDVRADLESQVDYEMLLSGCDVIVHLAGLAHQSFDSFDDSAFTSANQTATLNLARAAVKHGVKRFIFVSSIKVNGESTPLGTSFTASSAPQPLDAYGRSKLAAELGLIVIANTTSIEMTIIRPTLVYGPGVRANFSALMSMVSKQLPLPLSRVRNRRSLVGVGNLVSLITVCLDHPGAINQTFLVSDNSDLSTPELIREIAKAQRRRSYLFPVPMIALRLGAKIMRKEQLLSRLVDSLQVDTSSTIEKLGWTPPFTTSEGIAQTVDYWMSSRDECPG